jgi:hypothetical protein
MLFKCSCIGTHALPILLLLLLLLLLLPFQFYNSHHDWSVEDYASRYLTLLLYLTDQDTADAGGETAFPKADLKVHPGKGSAVLFYNILEDGNVDDLSLHAALPVGQGEKWLANVWIWDPKFSRSPGDDALNADWEDRENWTDEPGSRA